MASQGGDKTEKPTPQRVRKAREQGQFLSARGMIMAVEFIAALVLISKLLPPWTNQMRLVITTFLQLGMTHEMADAQWLKLLHDLAMGSLLPVLYFGGALLLITGAVNLGMTQMGFSMQKVMPQFNRLNPVSRLKDLPGQNLKSVVEAALLIAVLAMTINSVYQQDAATLLRLPFQGLPVASLEIGNMLEGLLWKAAIVFILFGSVDLFRQYRKHMSSLKMTKQEIKEENKRNEGDPHIKGKIRRLRRDMLRRQMIRDVPKATAVIVNPTHFAVAVRYDLETMSSPVVVAKGKNWLALQIRQVAVQHQVPIIENPPLARALYSAIDVGRPIPPEFYRAMAEILAYIYKMMGHKMPV
jgi:flagellar biosynthesis protein FlhB